MKAVQRTAIRVLGRALAAALVIGALGGTACGGPGEDKPKKERVEKKKAKDEGKKKEANVAKVDLPPLASPDCAAPLPALTGVKGKVEEASSLRAPATEGATKLSAGPILGDVTDQNVTVWISADRPTPWRVRAWPVKSAAKKKVFEGPEPSQASDFTAAVRLEQLTPSTEYAYEVELGVGKDATVLPKQTFHTLGKPGQPGKLRIAVGARLSGDPAQSIFAEIGAVKPDVLLLLGDLMYAGNLKASFPAYAAKYQNSWRGVENLKALMQNVPTYMMWDDQEIKNNYFVGGSKERYAPARLAFDLYAQAHNPAPLRDGELHYQFQAGDVSVFVLDGRSHRSDPRAPEALAKTMLGEDQKADLARFLKCAPGKIKIVATPLAFTNQVHGSGGWRDFESERQQLIRFIESENADNVIVLSGGQAWSGLFLHEHKKTRFYELMAAPLAKELGKAPKNESKGILARDDDNHVFGVVDIDTTAKPATIAFTLCAKGKPCKPGAEKAPASALDEEGDKETVPFTVKITEDDLGPKAPQADKAADEKPADEKKPAEATRPADAPK